MKHIVIISTHAPYGSTFNAEGFRSALGLVFSEFTVDIILAADGVYALMKNQRPEDLRMKSMGEVYENIRQYGIGLYYDNESLAKRRINREQLVTAQGLDPGELRSRLDSADIVLTF